MRIVVIGAGFGGLAVGIRLTAHGHDVTIVEKREAPGGRAYSFMRAGFTFDAGPTILTAPHLIDELFELSGRSRDAEIELRRLDPFYRVRFADGNSIEWSGDRERNALQISRLAPADTAGYRRFADLSQRIFNEAFPLADRPFNELKDMVRSLPGLMRARAWRSVASVVNDCVVDERIRQLLSFHPLLIGGNPFSAPAIYTLIHELERRWGVWYAVGGMGALVGALARCFERAGGTLHLGCEADSLELDAAGRASGVHLKRGGRLPADVVVSNGDVASTYISLVPNHVRRVNSDKRLRRKSYGMSVYVIYFGTDRRYEDVGQHEIILGNRYQDLLRDVFVRRVLAEDFSLYLHRPTASDPGLAPAGCDAWYVLSPVPNLGGNVDWEREGERYADRIMTSLEQRLLPGLRRHVVTQTTIDPRYFRDELNSHLGNAFSLEPLLRQSAWCRPHSVSRDVPNLYFVGAGTHPGAGIPGVLCSARIVAALIGAAPDHHVSQSLRVASGVR